MATRTASVSGKWSSTATWGGAAVPVDGDAFVINSGVLVEMDADTSGFASGLAASTINGTLYFSRTAGTYYLKMNANLTVSTTGTLDASDGAGGAYPATCTATIFLQSTFNITVAGNGIVTLRCGEPTHKYAKLTAGVAAAATVLTVDTDLTVAGDALWASPSLVRVDDINQAAESEQYTISSVSSTQVTLTAGLTNAKSIGAYVFLVTRNVKILGTGTSGGTGFSGATGAVVGAEIRALTTGLSACISATINGTVSGCTTGMASCTAPIVNGTTSGCPLGANACTAPTINGTISGCSSAAINNCQSPTINGTISGCTTGLTGCTAPTINGTISGCTNGLSNCGGAILRNATLSTNSRDLTNNVAGTAYNTLFASSTEYLTYTGAFRQLHDYMESIDHDQIAGAYRAWCRGGIVTSVASPVYDTSRVRSYKHTPESATAYVFMQRQVLVPAGGSVYVRCFVQKDASMAWLPRLWVFSADKEPLISGVADSEVIMSNSIGAWEVLESSVTNSTDAPKLYTVRTIASNASGNFYADPIIRTSAVSYPIGMQAGMVA